MNSETDFGPFTFPLVDPASPAELKWMWTKIGLGQLWDGPVWKNGIPFTSNIVTLAPREGAISHTSVCWIIDPPPRLFSPPPLTERAP